MEFCGLGYSRPDGATSDHFVDAANLTLEPEFEKYVRNAFAPVGLMLDFWDEKRIGGRPCMFPVVVINDLEHDWIGSVRLRIMRAEHVVEEKSLPCKATAWGRVSMDFHAALPAQSGHYQIEAALLHPNVPPVRSLRDVGIIQ